MTREEMHKIREHLFHMTDGRWHDNCAWCLERRVHGGTGLGPSELAAFRDEERRFLDEVSSAAAALAAGGAS